MLEESETPDEGHIHQASGPAAGMDTNDGHCLVVP